MAKVLIYFYDQIRACILFKLHSVAITLCGTMVEYSLKYCSYLVEAQNATVFDAELWATFEKDDFGKSIQRASANRLLDEKTKVPYLEFKNSFRNPYSHFNIQKLTKGIVFEKVEVQDTSTGETTTEEISATTGPVFQMLALEALDSRRVLDVFEFADGLVQNVFAKTFELPSDKAV